MNHQSLDSTPAEAQVSLPVNQQVGSLSKQATWGMLWNSLSSLIGRGLGFLNTIILTYWIDRADYGQANAAYVIAMTIYFLAIPGLGSDLIRRRERFEDAASLSVVICSLLALIFGGTVFVFADKITLFLNATGATFYLRIAVIIPIVITPLLTANCILFRQMRFGTQSLLELGGSLANVGTAICLAMKGLGGLAMVIGQILREGIINISATIITGLRWFRKPQWDSVLIRQMLNFGIPVYISELLEFAATNWDNLFIAKSFGAQALGSYAVAYTISYTPIYTITQRTSAVVLASVAQFADDHFRRKRAILRCLGAILLFLTPVVVLIMFDGPRVVQWLFPNRWTNDLSSLVVALSLVGIGLPLQILPDYYFQAIGRPRATVLVMVMKVTLIFGALFLFGRQNVVSAAWAVSISFLLAGLLACSLLVIVDNISARAIISELLPALVGGAVMAGVILEIRHVLQITSNVFMLLIETSGSCLVYLSCMLIFNRRQLQDVYHSLRGSN